jgi:hypothetical protein
VCVGLELKLRIHPHQQWVLQQSCTTLVWARLVQLTSQKTMNAELVKLDHEKEQDGRSLSSTARFAANWRLLIATQLFGESQKAGEIVSGFLDLALSTFRRRWRSTEDELAVHHKRVANEIRGKHLVESLEKREVVKREGTVYGIFRYGMAKTWEIVQFSIRPRISDRGSYRKSRRKEGLFKKYRKCTTFTDRGLAPEHFPKHNYSKNYEAL